MIQLAELTEEDIPALIGWINAETEEHFLQWGGAGGGFLYPLDKQQLESHIATSRGNQPIRRIFKAVHQGTGAMVGYVELNQINPIHRNAVVSRVLIGKAHRGQGFSYAMVSQLTDLAFTEYKLHRLSLGVFDFNTAARRSYEKIGFVREGILREILSVNDRYWSSILMSVLEHEWKARINVQSK